MLFSIARGDGAFGWLGARSSTFNDLHLAEVPQWFVFLVAGLVLYVAVIPAAATAVLCGLGLRRGATERVRLFAALALPTLTRHARVGCLRQRLDRRRRHREPQRALPVLRRAAPLRWARTLGGGGAAATEAMGMGRGARLRGARPRASDRSTGVPQRAPVDRARSVGRLADLGRGARGRGRGDRACLRLPVAALPQLGGGTTLGRGARRHVRRRRCRPVDPRRGGLERVEALRGAPSKLGRRIAPRRRRTSSCSGISVSPHNTSRTPSTRG